MWIYDARNRDCAVDWREPGPAGRAPGAGGHDAARRGGAVRGGVGPVSTGRRAWADMAAASLAPLDAAQVFPPTQLLNWVYLTTLAEQAPPEPAPVRLA